MLFTGVNKGTGQTLTRSRFAYRTIQNIIHYNIYAIRYALQ